MKTLKKIFILLAIGTVFVAGISCKKTGKKEQLPPATQVGANTFGFLLNGEVWLPKGPLLKQTLDLSYEPGYKGGTFNIVARRYFDDGNFQSVSLSSSNVNSTGTYIIASNKVVVYHNNSTTCSYHWNEDSCTQTGTLTITKIDLKNLFISGTFEFKLEKDGCPTVNATQGRFDLKIQ